MRQSIMPNMSAKKAVRTSLSDRLITLSLAIAYGYCVLIILFGSGPR